MTVPNSGNMYSPRWQSPEYLEGKEYATATDVFSFGVVLWEVSALQCAAACGYRTPCDSGPR